MKRSRACEDLRALECSSAPAATTSHNTSSLTGQRGVKRSKRHVEMVDSEFSDVEELSDSFLASIRVVDAAAENSSMQQHLDTLDALEFVMGMSSNYDRLSVSTACFDECLPPIRRNSRDVMPVVECDASSRSALQFKKKLQLGGAESSMMMVDSVDAPASDILCSRYQLETRCMDPLDKRQSLPFDMSSFIMLSINPNR